MQYELVQLSEKKTVAGVRMRTSNNDPDMCRSIGATWEKFIQEGIYSAIAGKKNGKSIGLYTNFEQEEKGRYDMLTCCEIEAVSTLPKGVDREVIASGQYAKFVIHGPIPKILTEFWSKLDALGLKRKYSSDFEEYQEGCDMENAEIHVYISLQEPETQQ